jgi:endoglucanase
VSVFDPELTRRIEQVAQRLGEQNETFAWQRKLMDGGACEATAYAQYGYRAACVCVPLGNYHNMQPDPAKIASEEISLRDWEAMLDLLSALPAGVGAKDGAEQADLRERLVARLEAQRHLLNPR